MDPVTRMFSTTTLVISSAEIILNGVLVATSMFRTEELIPSSYLVFWLCVSDTFLALHIFVVEVLFAIYPETINEGSASCRAQGFLIVFSVVASVMLCSGITGLRFMAVKRQVFYKIRECNLFLLSVIPVSAFVASIPFMLPQNAEEPALMGYGVRPSKVFCSINYYRRDLPAIVMVCVCLPILSGQINWMMSAYSQIYLELKQTNSTLREFLPGKVTANSSEPRSLSDKSDLEKEQRPSNNGAGDTGKVDVQRKRAASMLESISPSVVNRDSEDSKQRALFRQSFIIVASFLCGWTPYICMELYELATGHAASPAFDFGVDFCILINSGVSPVVVFLFDRGIQRNALRAFGLATK